MSLSASVLLANDADTKSSVNQIEVYQEGSDVSAPSLIPASGSFEAPEHCKHDIQATIVLDAIIDSQGRARNLHFLDASASDLDKMALLIANGERFKPGIYHGSPVAVAQKIKLQMIGCYLDTAGISSTKQRALTLKALPQQYLSTDSSAPHQVVFGADPMDNAKQPHGDWHLYVIGKDATEPKLVKYANAEFSDEARHAHIQGTVALTCIVDSNGIPQNIQVDRGIGWGLDENAIATVSRYRFTPAQHNGQPVAVTIHIQVRFHTD